MKEKNYKFLRQVLWTYDITIAEVAEAIGISKVTFYNRLKNEFKWKHSEMINIQAYVNERTGKNFTLGELFEM